MIEKELLKWRQPIAARPQISLTRRLVINDHTRDQTLPILKYLECMEKFEIAVEKVESIPMHRGTLAVLTFKLDANENINASQIDNAARIRCQEDQILGNARVIIGNKSLDTLWFFD